MAFHLKKTMSGVVLTSLLLGLTMGTAFAQETGGLGEPQPWQMGLQEAATPVMDYIRWFHGYVMWFIVPITLFVMALLLYVIFRFNKKANPVPSKVTHNTLIEVIWTVGPILILVLIALPSFKLLYFEEVIPKADLTIKATASQWSWDYEYPDNGDFTFTSTMRRDEDKVKAEGKPWLLAVDNEMVVPVNKTVVVQVTATDVIHAFSVNSFGVKIDAIPGRLNETWFKATREGWYYGQCSQLCGHDHAFMPISVHVVSQEDFDKWAASKKSALNGDSQNKVASAAAIVQ
ncbi:cytochrome c oxidase subunit II [Labrys okinawensis]|uniref:cytochrome c oxidase subunit II n=1 Tax=Labrys okinawensis TaxID=346911 RepID=UPI0039BC49BA